MTKMQKSTKSTKSAKSALEGYFGFSFGHHYFFTKFTIISSYTSLNNVKVIFVFNFANI